jgi:large subunit ribosomal protein L19e
MDLSSKKRLAARMLGVGESRVRIDPDSLETVADAITREAVRGLISAGLIWAVPAKGVSRGRVRFRHRRNQLRGSGPGRKKGTAKARAGGDTWPGRVRALRKRLRVHKDRANLSPRNFRVVYKQIKGGQIRTVKRLEEAIREVSAR